MMKNIIRLFMLTSIICFFSACGKPYLTESSEPQKQFSDGSEVKFFYDQKNIITQIEFISVSDRKTVTYIFDPSLGTEYRNIILDSKTTTGKIKVGKMVETNVNINEEIIYSNRAEFNSKGVMEKSVFYALDGRILSYWVLDNIENNCSKYIHYSAEDEKIGELITQKDDQGEVLREDWVGKNGEVEYWTEYKFNKDGKLTEEIQYYADKEVKDHLVYIQ